MVTIYISSYLTTNNDAFCIYVLRMTHCQVNSGYFLKQNSSDYIVKVNRSVFFEVRAEVLNII
jgi:hypothetical protein